MHLNKQRMITRREIENVWGNANFGENTDKIAVIKDTLLKRASGYHSGFTAMRIVRALGLITPKDKLSVRGRYCLYHLFEEDINT